MLPSRHLELIVRLGCLGLAVLVVGGAVVGAVGAVWRWLGTE